MELGDNTGRLLASNLLISDLVSRMAPLLGGTGVARLLDLAGDDRSVKELTDTGGWSTYEQYRAILEGAAEVLGSLDALTEMIFEGATPREGQRAWHRFRASKTGVWRNSLTMMPVLIPFEESELEVIGPDEWIMRSRLLDGYPPFRAHCAWRLGARAATPLINGYPAPFVEELACQCDGAPECVVRIVWNNDDNAELAARVGYLESEVSAADNRFNRLSGTVGELFSGEILSDVLPRIVASAAETVIASGIVLAVRSGFSPEAVVLGVGADPARRDIVGRRLLDGDDLGEGVLTMEVRSTQAMYGWLAAIDPLVGDGGAVDVDGLRTYARLAAAALDSAGALEEARTQATTAHTLLDLSTSLSGALTMAEACSRVTRAVRRLVDCDSASVFLIDGNRLVPVAHEWFSGSVARELGHRSIPLRAIPFAIDRPNFCDVATADEHTAAVMGTAGWAAAACVPVIAGGEQLGVLAVCVSGNPSRVAETRQLTSTLAGLASQAGSAIANARLLEQIRHQALHDSLTGLPNRALILDRTEQMLARARREQVQGAALFVDLDHFKDINDSLGHEAGDQVLQQVATRLASALRETDTVARLGGDEFVVLVEAWSWTFGAEEAAERLLAVLAEPIHIAASDEPIIVTASVGVAIGERNNAGELLRDADIALYEAKDRGRNQAVVFHRDMQRALEDRHQLEHELRVALSHGELFLVYQPTLNLETGDITGVEALIRWQHPTRGVVSPDDFIHVAEELGVIVPIGAWVLREACLQAATWRADGHPLRMAVNVSARQIEDRDFYNVLRQALAESGLDPASLTLEITETTLMRDTAATLEHLRRIKATGVRIAIDDFGTGYSSLAYLQQFPVDSLKIDRSFVAGMSDGPESAALIRTLVQLGKSLGIETLAEGIELPEQLVQLQLERCDTGQGFLFARPLPPAEFLQLMDDQRSTRSLTT